MNSPLARFAHLHQEPNASDARSLARLAYHNHGLVLINPEWLQSWIDRKQLEILADKVHGKKGKK